MSESTILKIEMSFEIVNMSGADLVVIVFYYKLVMAIEVFT